MKMTLTWTFMTGLALAIAMVNYSVLRAGGLCCPLESNVKFEESAREQIDSGILEAIGHFHLGLAELERVNLDKLREGHPGPELRIQVGKAALEFRDSADGLSVVLGVCRQQKVSASEMQMVQQLQAQIAAAANTAGAGTYPNPANALNAIRLCTQIVRDGGERAVLHQGMPGHLPITLTTP